jgi:hypothetical protein
VFKYLPLILTCGCAPLHHEPDPSDTKFNNSNRDWAETYKYEMKVAVENEDKEAYDFFFEEYMKFRIEQYKLKNKK